MANIVENSTAANLMQATCALAPRLHLMHLSTVDLNYYPGNIDLEYHPGNIVPMESFAAFHNTKLLSRGPLSTVLPAVHSHACKAAHEIVFIQESSGRSVDFDWRGSAEEVLTRAEAQFAKGKPSRGRPKLGVQSREVTLLPRHWAWLDQQQGARSAVLRRLVDKAMKTSTGPNVDAVYGAMSTLAGDLPNFEDASRALFARDNETFAELIQAWPTDLRDYFSMRMNDPRQDASQSSLT